MAEILALIEAIAAEVPDCDMKLAEMLEGEPEHVRIAMVEKLRQLLKARAAEKEKELDRILESQKRQVVERQRKLFVQWLQWIMSEETLRKIRVAFLARPGLEGKVQDIGQQLAAKGVLQQMQQTHGKQDLGELSVNLPGAAKGQERDTGKGRGS